MADVGSVEITLPDDKKVKIESGILAKQANGSVVLTCKDTVLLATVVVGDKPQELLEDEGMVLLMVDYREPFSAAGKIPGGFIKREGRPTVKEILTSRLIDRPLRPMLFKDFPYDIQVIVNVLSADRESDPDIYAINAASAALMVSDVPFNGPVGGIRVGMISNRFIVNPTYEELRKSDLDLVICGNKDGIIMVEMGAKEVAEEKIVEAMLFAQVYIKEFIQGQIKLRELCGKPTIEFEPKKMPEGFYEKVKEKFIDKMKAVFFVQPKKERNKLFKKLYDEIVAEFSNLPPNGAEPLERERNIRMAYDAMETELVRSFALSGKRADGRSPRDIRPISINIGILPRAHGSAIFTRGETQAFVTVTLGTQKDEQIVDGLDEEYSKKFMLHYNFPPFSTGEIKFMRAPSRREIGHGALAERALKPVLPSSDEFPYTIRVVSDILESNGSSSMASVCGGSLSLMDAGVKIKAPVAGIAMGLIKEGDKFCILSDILGSEDRHGDMDFKVAGTNNGVSAMQMDVKTPGIDFTVIKKALEQAKEGRLYILEKMNEAISQPKKEISPHAPRLIKIAIDPQKIGLLIGPGGKTIRDIQNKTGAELEISDDGTVAIYAENTQIVEDAVAMVETTLGELKIGKIYKAKVTSVKDFGAFIEILPAGQEGLLHISELAEGFVRKTDDVVKPGDVICVKVISFDELGRPRFSLKQAQKEINNQ